MTRYFMLDIIYNFNGVLWKCRWNRDMNEPLYPFEENGMKFFIHVIISDTRMAWYSVAFEFDINNIKHKAENVLRQLLWNGCNHLPILKAYIYENIWSSIICYHDFTSCLWYKCELNGVSYFESKCFGCLNDATAHMFCFTHLKLRGAIADEMFK